MLPPENKFEQHRTGFSPRTHSVFVPIGKDDMLRVRSPHKLIIYVDRPTKHSLSPTQLTNLSSKWKDG